MHVSPLIYDLAIILGVAGLITALFLKIKQPVVVGLILAGLVVGPHTPPFQLVTDVPSIKTLAELGIIFLMFTLGLEFSFRKLMSVGATAVVAAVIEVFFFLVVGFLLGKSFGWSDLEGFFLGAMLAISSTTIIIKALEELKLKTHKFSSLIFGILIVEDLLAILLLVSLTSLAQTQTFSLISFTGVSLKLFFITTSWFIVGHLVIPKLMAYFARKGSNEIITLVSIGLCLTLVVVGVKLGYSPALGAFIMGSILAETRLIHEIEILMAPLKDLFGAIFFVSIGMLIEPKIIWEYKETIALLCVVTILGKIFITTLGTLLTGQTLKNSIQVGFGLAQIGEFSFIIAGVGMSFNVIDPKIYPIIVTVSCITTFTTPYLIKFSSRFADQLEKTLPLNARRGIEAYVEWWAHRNGLNSFSRLIPFVKDLFNRPEPLLSSPEASHPFGGEAPWEAHLYTFTVHPNSALVSQTISESQLRRKTGINIVALRRGNKTLIIPDSKEKILPMDQLIVLGNDEQLDLARGPLETPENFPHPEKAPESYALKNYVVSASSTIRDKTIEELKFRENYEALVVGVEQGGAKMMNPPRDFVIKSGDILWLVGEKTKLENVKL